MPDATHARLIMPGVLRMSYPVISVAYPPSTPLIFRRSDMALTPHPTMRADAMHACLIMPGALHVASGYSRRLSAINTFDFS
ncbi:TPA: hypothetical protein ACN6Y1_000109 [Escherichia albertii]